MFLCPECGKGLKNATALGAHRSHIHHIKGARAVVKMDEAGPHIQELWTFFNRHASQADRDQLKKILARKVFNISRKYL